MIEARVVVDARVVYARVVYASVFYASVVNARVRLDTAVGGPRIQ